MSLILTIVCSAIFLAGFWCYGLAFQVEPESLRFWVFLLGILLNSLAFFIPWQLIGHSRK